MDCYKQNFKNCHLALKKMKMAETYLIGFVALPKLKEVLLDIEAIKSGDFILADNWRLIKNFYNVYNVPNISLNLTH